jgi:hypothetical protein
MRVDQRERDLENHDRGLDYDLPRLLHRRGMLKLVAGAGLASAGLITLGACAQSTSTADTSAPQDGRPPGPPGGGRVGGAAQPTQTSDTATGRFPRRRPGRTQETAQTVPMC